MDSLSTSLAEAKLDEHVAKLSKSWSAISHSVDRYIDAAGRHLAKSKSVLAEVQGYVSCDKSGSSFIKAGARNVEALRTEAAAVLRKEWSAVLKAVIAHDSLFHGAQIPHQTVLAAAAAVRYPAAKGKYAAYWLSNKGVKETESLLAAKLDDVPLRMARQSLSMFSKARFLHARLQADGGQEAGERDSKHLIEAFDRMVGEYRALLDTLRPAGGDAALLRVVTDAALVDVYPASALCKALAFEHSREAATSSLVSLAKNKAGHTVISHPLGALLSYKKPFRIVVSKNMGGQSIPADFPTSALVGTFICDEEGGTLQPAMQADESDAIVFCSGKGMCREGDIEIGAEAVQEASLASSKLLKLFAK